MDLKRINHPITWIAAFVIVAGIAVAFWYLSAEAVPLPTPASSSPLAADFTLPSTNGNVVKLTDFRGRVIVLNLWSPECDACYDEVQTLIRLQRDFRKDIAVILVAVGTDAATVRAAMSGLNLNFPVVIDDGTVAKAYPGDALPRTYFIDRDGRLRATVPKHPTYPYHYFRTLTTNLISGAR